MWRSGKQRAGSALRRLRLAEELWGWRPHARQRALFSSPAQVRVAACGRRWGKTESLAVDVATLALLEPGCRQLIVAPTDVQARLLGGEVLRLLMEAFESGHAALGGRTLTVRHRPSLCVRLEGAAPVPGPEGPGYSEGSPSGAEDPTSPRPGTSPRPSPSARRRGQKGKKAGGGESVIWCRSAGRDGRSLRGLWAHRIIVDEAGAVPDTVLTDVLLPMLIDVGGEYLLASSPMGRRSAYYRLFVRGSDTSPQPSPSERRGSQTQRTKRGRATEGVSYAAFRCPTSDNPHLDHAFLLAQREELGEAAARQELDAEFVDDFGAVFREEDIQAALKEDGRVSLLGQDLVSEPVPGKLYTVGIDWGRRLDFTVVCVLECCPRDPSPGPEPHPGPLLPQGEGEDTSAARVVGLWRWQGVGWDSQVAAVAGVLARFRPWRVLADGNSIGDPLVDALNKAPRTVRDDGYGGQVERFLFTADSKAALVDRLALGLSGRSVSYPYHRALVQELYGFEYGKVGPSGKSRTGARAGGHDDCVMALALAWWAAPEAAPPPPSELILLGSSVGMGKRES
jgi:hypothetical protein